MTDLLLFDFLRILDPEVTPKNCKIHLAGSNGQVDPIDEYFAGTFNDWQSIQSQKNFERPFVLSLISLSERDQWLFAGIFDANGATPYTEDKKNFYRYSLTQRPQTKNLDGRLIVGFARSGRQSYLVGENWVKDLKLLEIRPQRMTIRAFPGYSKVRIKKSQLDLIVGQEIASWKGALSNIAGIYLISDTMTGKHYVGKATGGDGIWGRWCAYAANGHGGNAALRKVLGKNGPAYAENFQFSILEIADSHASEDDILARESHWKETLLSRDFGYNDN